MKYTIDIPDELLEIFKRNKTNPMQALKSYFIDFVLEDAKRELEREALENAREKISVKLNQHKKNIIVKKTI